MKFLLLLFPFCVLKSQHLWQIYPDTIITWNYYDGDEFNKPQLKTSLWQHGYPWSRSMFMYDNYILDENLRLESGKAIFTVKKLDTIIRVHDFEASAEELKKHKMSLLPGNQYKHRFSTSLLWSHKQYMYGYFEIKFKGVVGQGVWPAFWLFGGNPNYEIDFFELKGEKEKKLHVDVHCPDGCADFYKGIFVQHKGWGHWIKLNEKLSDGYNIISGEWHPNYIRWYLNGELIAQTTMSISIPMNLIVGTGMAKNNGPFAPGPNKKTPFPNTFEVDYIRVYKLNFPTQKVKLIDNFYPIVFSDSVSKADYLPKAKTKTTKSLNERFKTVAPITLSVHQINAEQIAVRVLGATLDNQIHITILDSDGKIITNKQFENNGDATFRIQNNQKIFLHYKAKFKTGKMEIELY